MKGWIKCQSDRGRMRADFYQAPQSEQIELDWQACLCIFYCNPTSLSSLANRGDREAYTEYGYTRAHYPSPLLLFDVRVLNRSIQSEWFCTCFFYNSHSKTSHSGWDGGPVLLIHLQFPEGHDCQRRWNPLFVVTSGLFLARRGLSAGHTSTGGFSGNF